VSLLYGVDLSNWQAGISLAGVAREGFTFAICKITQGDDYRSPEWPRQRDEARAAGLVLAGYHYVDQSDPMQQALNCRAHIGDTSLAVALDLEKGGGDIRNYRAVLDAFRRAGLRVALSYIPRWYWQEIGSPPIADLPPLWSSRYPSTDKAYASQLYQAVERAGGSLSKYWQGYGGNTVRILQFASTAQVQGRDVDANAFLGSPAELVELIGPGGSAVPPTEPVPLPPRPTPFPREDPDDMPTAREVADAILDTPIPRLGDGQSGATSLRNELAWMTTGHTHLAWAAPAVGDRVARAVDGLAAAGSSTPDELRALRAQLDRIEARLDAAPVAGETVELEAAPWRGEVADLLEHCAAAVRATEQKGNVQ